jgi:hypothetical protein
MLFIDIVLSLAAAAFVSSAFIDRRRARNNRALLAENEKMKEVVFSFFDDTDSSPRYPHDWGRPTEDIVYTSKSPLSNDVVVANTAVCTKCQLVHRYIVRGFSLAKKSVPELEGFYFSGIKVADRGCPVKSPEFVDVFDTTIIDQP